MKPQALIVGGGRIVHDQILPSLYHLQRQGRIGEIAVCATTQETVRRLAEAEILRRAFPGQSFRMWPPGAVKGRHPRLFRQAIAALPPRQIVVVAAPDHLHYDVAMEAIEREQHVCCVKPLAMEYRQGVEIADKARRQGVLAAVDYHRRFDERSLMARTAYRDGRFGEFRLGAAYLLEKWSYRHSSFQEWMTAEHSDAFTYAGCHYVDLVAFITGLLPVAVSVYGILDRFPNGKEGYLWTDARVRWENGGCLNVQSGAGLPDAAPGANAQGMTLYCQRAGEGACLVHSAPHRGVDYCHAAPVDYAERGPDFFQYVDLGGPGLTPAGYGYRSLEAIVMAAIRVNAEGAGALDEIERGGILATAANSSYNERVVEAGRESILNGGREVTIRYLEEAA